MNNKYMLYKNLPKKSLGGWASEKLGIGKSTIAGKVLAGLGDAATVMADNTLSIVGGNNIINDNSYSTDFAKKASNLTGNIYSTTGVAAANMLVPGGGSLLSGVQGAVNNAVGDPNTNPSASDIAKYNQTMGAMQGNNSKNIMYTSTFADGGDLGKNSNNANDADYLKFQQTVQNDQDTKDYAELNYYKLKLDDVLRTKDKSFDEYINNAPRSIKDSMTYADDLYTSGKTSARLKPEEIKTILGDKYQRYLDLKTKHTTRFNINPGEDYGYRNSLMIKPAGYTRSAYDENKNHYADYIANVIYNPENTDNPYEFSYEKKPIIQNACGGKLANGGPINIQNNSGAALKYSNNGLSHEENSLGGYPVDKSGNINIANPVGTVEKGEVVKDGYVYSNRLQIPGKKSTFAYLATRYKKELDESTNDPLRKKVIDEKFDNLMTKQEELKVVRDYAKSMGESGKFNSEKTYQKWLQYATKAAENKQVEQLQNPEVNQYQENEYAEGGGIHIKESHKGRFTAYKERTGKTTEEALHSPNAHVRQMANFARNAATWKHAEGGNLPKYSGDDPNSSLLTGGTQSNDFGNTGDFIETSPYGGNAKTIENFGIIGTPGIVNLPGDSGIIGSNVVNSPEIGKFTYNPTLKDKGVPEAYTWKEPLYTSVVPAAANLISGIITDRALAKTEKDKLNYTPINPELIDLSRARNQAKSDSAFTESKMKYAAKNAGLTAAQYTQLVNEGAIGSQRELDKNLSNLYTTEETTNAQARNEANQFNAQSQFKVDAINRETKNNARLARIQNLRNTLQGVITPELQRRSTENNINLSLIGSQLGSKDLVLVTGEDGKPRIMSREFAIKSGMKMK